MRVNLAALVSSVVLIAGVALAGSPAHASAKSEAQPMKDWTFLVYLNGNNSLDSFGALNISQMEKVGSTDSLNIVVQWASLQNGKTERLYVVKNPNPTPNTVISPVLEDLGPVDMGDYQSLTSFIQWAAIKYPAKHYLVDVWDHGSGWHALQAQSRGQGFNATDISYDQNTGHWITTQQLGQAMRDGAKAIGHKIDLYASDACLMAMPEVAGEMADSVLYFGGSEQTEPGAGWPYDTFLQRWQATPGMDTAGVAQALTEEYVKSYQNGENGSQEATYSAFDLGKFGAFEAAVKGLGTAIQAMPATARAQLIGAAQKSLNFTNSDYIDLLDFLSNAEKAQAGLSTEDLAAVRDSVKNLVIANKDTDSFQKATGLSIWLPTDKSTYDTYSKLYQGLVFEAHTAWSDALKVLMPADGSTPALLN